MPLVEYLTNEGTLFYKYQTLIGAIVGVIGALFVAFIGFVLNHYYQKYKELRESMRLVEVNLALGMNDIYDTERHLNDFLERLNTITITPLRTANPTQYFLTETNFPILSVHLDTSLLHAKYNSYYVHNKVLIIVKNIQRLNENFVDMKVKYEAIAKKAEFLMQQGATPLNQQRDYLVNNENFALFVQDIIDQLQLAKKIFAQAKIYNLKLINKERFTVWCLEGVRFKFFLNKKKVEEYRNTLDSLDRIDNIIASEVASVMERAEERRDSTEVPQKEYFGDRLYVLIKKILKRLGLKD